MDDSDRQNTTKLSSEQNLKPSRSKQKWSLKKKLYVIGGAIVGVFLVLLLITNAATSAPVKVSNQLVADIQAVNGASAYTLLSSSAKNVTDPQEFNATVDHIGPILNGTPKMKSKEVKGETGTSATAKVVYSIHGSDGLTYTFTVNLVKEGSDWKVLNFASEKE